MMNTLHKYVAAVVLCGLTAACHRAPQTAEELWKQMPRQYRGELHLQGETQSLKVQAVP